MFLSAAGVSFSEIPESACVCASAEPEMCAIEKRYTAAFSQCSSAWESFHRGRSHSGVLPILASDSRASAPAAAPNGLSANYQVQGPEAHFLF